MITVDPNRARFLIFETVFLSRATTLPYVKKISQKWVAFTFGSIYLHQTFTECVSNQYAQYWHARCDRKLWKAIWFFSVLWVFSYIIYDYSCLKCCIFTKLSQIVWKFHILVCQHAKCDPMLWKVFFQLRFWEFFIYYYMFETR